MQDTGARDDRETIVDVLVITALPEEFEAAKAVIGAPRWREYGGGGPAPYSRSHLRTRTGATMSVALARPTQMGGRGTGPVATT